MKIYDEYIDNSLKKKKFSIRPLKISIFIAVLALSIFIFIMGSILESEKISSKEIFGDYHVILKADFKDKISLIADNVNVEKIGFLEEKPPEKVKNSNLKLKIFLLDENYSEILASRVKKGKLPENDNEIVLPILSAKDLGLKIGDFFKTENEGKEITYRLVGLSDGYVGSWEDEIICYGYKPAEVLKNNPTQIAIWYKNIKDTFKITPKIVESLGYGYQKSLEESLSVPDADIKMLIEYNFEYLGSNFVMTEDIYVDNTAKSFPKIFFVGITLIGVFFVFVIKNVFNIWEDSQIREYGLLLSIGAKKKEIKNIILKRIYRISIIPIILGIGFGVVATFIIIKVMNRYYNLASEALVGEYFDRFWLSVRASYFLVVIFAIVAVLLFSAMGAIRKVSKLNIIDSMKLYRNDDKKHELKVLKKDSFLSDFSKINFSQNKGKIIFSAFSISIASLFLCLMLSFLSGLNLTTKYDTVNELENYEYLISYINPSPFPKDLIEKFTENKYDYISLRENRFFLLQENSYEKILDSNYRENYYKNFIKRYGNEELYFDLVGISENKYEEILKKLNVDEGFERENSGIIINSLAKDFDKPINLIECSKVLNEDVKTLKIGEYGNKFIEEHEGIENRKLDLNILAFTDDPNILKVPINKKSITFVTSLDNYFKLMKDTKQSHTGLITEKIYFDAKEDLTLEKIKNILEENISTRDLEVWNSKTIGAFEYYANGILYSWLLSIAIIATAVGLSQVYSATSTMKEKRKQEYTMLKIIGMDDDSIKKLALKEVNISMKYILVFSLVLTVISIYIAHTGYKYFSVLEIFLNMKIYIWAIYLVAVYLILRKHYLKTTQDINLTNNSRII